MNEDRVADMSQKFDSGIRRLEMLFQEKSGTATQPLVPSRKETQKSTETTDVNYVEHSFGGIPIPKAPAKTQEARMGDMSGLVVTETEDVDDLLLGS